MREISENKVRLWQTVYYVVDYLPILLSHFSFLKHLKKFC